MVNVLHPSPGDDHDIDCRLELISWFWRELYVGENPGETTWEELGVLRSQVDDALAGNPPDVSIAETLTAYAMALSAGMPNL